MNSDEIVDHLHLLRILQSYGLTPIKTLIIEASTLTYIIKQATGVILCRKSMITNLESSTDDDSYA